MTTLNFGTVNFNTLNVGTLHAGIPPGLGVMSIVAAGETLGYTIHFQGQNGVTISVSGQTIIFEGSIQSGINKIIANSSTLQGDVTFLNGPYTTFGVNGNSITIGSTIPPLSVLSGQIT